MEEPLFVLKSDVFNAVLPAYLRNFFYALLFLFPLLFLGMLLSLLHFIAYTVSALIMLYAVIGAVVAILPLIVMIVGYLNTSYYFYNDRVVREFRFIIIRQYSVIYAKINNIDVKISLWDRVCNAGDITLHTAADDEPNLVLKYIKSAEKVQFRIHELIQAAVGRASSGSAHRASQHSSYPVLGVPPPPPRKTHIAPHIAPQPPKR